jgi:glycosyltransferase involved in cell wall biosynthesis
MITAIVLTKNNAQTIEKTLDSLSWCDEIICIDDFSTDATGDHVKKQKADVYQRHLANDFAAQRNFGLEQAKGDWILFVDSDEIVSEALQREIRETISREGSSKKGIQGYFIKRDDIFFGKKLRFGETRNVRLLRLARKNAGIWKRPVHEYWDIKGATDALENPLVHSSHTDVAQFISKINSYTTINARYLHALGVRSNVLAIIFYPLAKFFWNYFFLLGFLDGTPGAIMAIMMSFHSFLTRAKLYLLEKR